MKRNFFTGFLSGLFGAILIFALIGTGYVFLSSTDSGKENGTTLEAKEKGKDQEAENEEITYEEIVEKLTFLKMLVDNYFLEEVDSSAFADGIYKGFIASLNDPYSTYYTKEEYDALRDSSSGIYHGIGAHVSQDTKTGIITLIPFEKSPASEAGVLKGDILYKVEEEEVTGMDLSEVVSKIKGVEGTPVHITVIRDGEPNPLEYTITRREIKVPTVEYKMLDNKIGYIVITEFDEVTISQFNDAINSLEKSGMKGLVVDVRNNPGGLLYSVVEILDRLLPKGLIVYTEDKHGIRQEENADDDIKLEVPLAVLINGYSASASEIFAGAIQDYKVGTIVGTTSFGKGIVQKVIPLSDGTAIKLTISKYFTPKGRNIHGTGIMPDVEVDLADELKQLVSIPIEKDNQLQEALKIVKDQIDKK